jgi:predicted metal-binding membrane protein
VISATTAARGGPRRIPLVLIIAIAVAWLLAVTAQLSGASEVLGHDYLAGGSLPVWAAVAVFAVTWQAMTVAMMLPSSVPMISLFTAAARRQERPALVIGAFLGGYASVWTAFGVAAFVGDIFLHRTLDSTSWWSGREWILSAGVLALAGAFQFSGLKDRCLRECRHPASFLLQYYARGSAAAFKFGARHGLFCLGCCWAVMLVMFAAGVANLWWMAALTALMVYEKVAPRGEEVVVAAGVVFLVLAGAVAVLGVVGA